MSDIQLKVIKKVDRGVTEVNINHINHISFFKLSDYFGFLREGSQKPLGRWISRKDAIVIIASKVMLFEANDTGKRFMAKFYFDKNSVSFPEFNSDTKYIDYSIVFQENTVFLYTEAGDTVIVNLDHIIDFEIVEIIKGI